MMSAEVNLMIENIGRNIKRLRERHQVTQEDLANVAEVQRDTISKIEQNKRNPSFDTLDRIARFFNVAPVDLLGSPTEQEIHNTTAILDRIDTTLDRIEEYLPKLERLEQLMWKMQDFSPRQIDHLADELTEIFKYFEPYTPVDEDGVPDTDRNDRQIVKQSRYRDLPVKEIDKLYKQIQEIKSFHSDH
jgi:transcriptional regulator with XRE-family HTH domain